MWADCVMLDPPETEALIAATLFLCTFLSQFNNQDLIFHVMLIYRNVRLGAHYRWGFHKKRQKK